MKAFAFRIMLLIAAIFIAAVSLQAAPSLSITKGPVGPFNNTGPNTDPTATSGQWFLNASGEEEFRTHEFHDNVTDHGGDDPHVIDGRVISLTTNAANHITAFTIDATIENNTPRCYGQESDSSNSHNELRPAETDRYIGTLLDTRLTVEFAIAEAGLLPQAFTGPYQNPWPPSFIIAENEDQLAWYCWNEQDPPQGDEPGNYYVPTWDFGDIAINQRVTKTLNFKVNPPMDPTDPRYAAIYGAYEDGKDMFINRTTSLKISTWIDGIGIDFGDTYPDDVFRSSDVSVFHNIEEPVEPPHKMHWPQLPDPFGWDVRACTGSDELQKVLADDFRCTSNGPITHITFWGSFQWDENMPEFEFHGINKFHLSLHDDIPDSGLEGDYSKPVVPALWEMDIDPYAPPAGWIITVEQETPSPQGWYDPNNEEWSRPDHENYYRYDVFIPKSEAFVQTEGTIYWLDISVETQGPMWGWKTSRSEHFNDDAVWADLPVLNTNQWNELIDPVTEESLDLAFIIDGDEEEEPEEEFDWGDAPDSPAAGGFNTLASNIGANHTINMNYILGTLIDAELDGQPTAAASGDDVNNVDDEDGITFTSLFVPGQNASFNALVSVAGQLDIWMDLNNNGVWNHPGEHVFGGGVNPGSNPLSFAVPYGTPPGQNVLRFRFTSSASAYATGAPLPSGNASDGEVEDYTVDIEKLDWGDAPDTPYPTFAVNSGANHLIGSSLYLGALIDAESDGQPNALANGDDLVTLDDEDGVTFKTCFFPGAVAQMDVTAVGSGLLDIWIDFNVNGSWLDPGEQVYTDHLLSAGTTTLTIPVPTSALPSTNTYMRVRYSSVSGLHPTGYASDGEVEDYMIDIEDLVEIDWGDVPDPGYPVLAANNGAHHILSSSLCLGATVDAEPDGQPTINADGDNKNLLYPGIAYPPGDEDGVIQTCSALMPGGYASVDVIASQAGILDAWIDFNLDNSWAQTSDQIFSNQPLTQGTNSLLFPVPLTARTGIAAHCRFRLTSGTSSYPGGTVLPTGLALDGEVEDYHWLISAVPSGNDWGDAPDPSYPTLAASVGATHTISVGILLGATIDAESDGVPKAAADGDDTTGIDDEDGVTFASKIVAGTNASIQVVAGFSGGYLDAWIDFNADGDWADSGEKIATATLLSAGLNTLSVPVPQPSALGPTYARFRISSGGGLTPSGLAADGEVEDYLVELFQPAPSVAVVITNLMFNTLYTVATVEWAVENGITYQMESNTNLVTGPWIPAGSTVISPANSQTDSISANSNKFYRVTAPWTP